jgi:hypothetical protein
MPKAYWLPPDDPGKRDWLAHFAGELGNHASTVGIAAGEVTAVQADSAFFTYVMAAQQAFANAAQQWTSYKNKARNGTGTSMGPMPVSPTLGTPPAAVAPGIFTRVAKLVVRIKAHPGYTESIGQALDIIGAEQVVDPATMKPLLKTELLAGHPLVKWPKGAADALEIWVDRGTGTFVSLAIDTVPDYLNTYPLPAPGQTALWRYKAIYRIGDEQVGQWSDVVSQPVAG